ncbi:MAG: hypothetical protein J0I12_18255 [Candidatus Eremiobacteraeota bacterium]|nr:hypothetical protein [Candidatus Eremiobacteraeota bacterium]
MDGELPVPREELENFLRTSSQPFGTFVRADGDVWMLERSMVEWFLNELPQPSQASLDEMTRSAVRVRFVEGGCLEKPLGKKVVLEVKDRDKIRELADLLQLVPEEPRWHCMCHGDYAVGFLQEDGAEHFLGFHHGHALRRDGVWGGDATLASPLGVLKWLDSQGLVRPLRGFLQDEKQREAEQGEVQSWLEAGPVALRESVALWLQKGQKKEALSEVYAAASAVSSAQLLEWIASGVRQHYQSLPAWILDKMDPSEIFAGLGAEPSEKQLIGLALLVFEPLRLPLLLQIPTPLRRQLLQAFPREGAYHFSDQLPRDYEGLLGCAPPELLPVLEKAWSKPRDNYGVSYFEERKVERLQALLAWAERIPPRSFQAFRALLNLVDSLICSVPLEESKPILLGCSQSSGQAVARHLAEAPGYADGAFADFPRAAKKQLVGLGESLRLEALPRLKSRLGVSRWSAGALEMVKLALAVGLLWWLSH